MDKGGNLKSHNHEAGWLTGTFYLQMPDKGLELDEGAIEFSHQGPKYPAGDSVFKKRIMRPLLNELVMNSLAQSINRGQPETYVYYTETVNTEEQAVYRSTGANNHGTQWGKAAVEMALLRASALGGMKKKSFMGYIKICFR